MRFREALRIAARRFGLVGYPEARLGQAGVSLVVGSALLVLGAVSAILAVAGAGIWLFGVAAGIRGLFRVGGERS
ncbi:MAG TPA: hypothetical protein VN618_15315 [Solirubrobacteraceae bacterium]|nr:hypothetical protein [Solirubrobacteraceae bacterium]